MDFYIFPILLQAVINVSFFYLQRANLTDFDRFKLMKAKQSVSRLTPDICYDIIFLCYK